jgi:hydrogenase maturation protease
VAGRRLAEAAGARVAFRETPGEGAALLDAWDGAALVVLIDAVRSGARAGTVHRVDARAEPMPAGFFRYSTHAFGVAEAVELSRALGRLPRRLIVFGIEGRDFTPGVGLSPAVERAVARVVRRALAEIDGARASATPGGVRRGRSREG